MHLQQTKVGSRTSGGPQYYFHDVPAHVKEFLRKPGAGPVVLQTPYGIASSLFTAVGRDHKLSRAGKVVRGKAGRARRNEKKTVCEDEPERNVSAAIRLTDGSVYTGFAHGIAMLNARSAHERTPESRFSKLFEKSRDGFLSSKGRFVGRDEAYRIAVKSGQMTAKSYADAHQDLWGERLPRGGGLCALSFDNARTDKKRK